MLAIPTQFVIQFRFSDTRYFAEVKTIERDCFLVYEAYVTSNPIQISGERIQLWIQINKEDIIYWHQSLETSFRYDKGIINNIGLAIDKYILKHWNLQSPDQ